MEQIFAAVQEKIFEVCIVIVVTGLFYSVGSVAVAWISRRLIRRAYANTLSPEDLTKRENTLVGLIRNIWKILIVSVGLLAFARLFVSAEALAPLFASAGIVGIALGFGAQTMVRDFLTGLFIISENQYRVGDVIEIDSFSGTVERVGIRSTVLRDVNGNVHYFPNGIIEHVINKTMDYSKARVVIAVKPETNIDTASTIINRIGKQMSQDEKWAAKIIEPPEYVMLGDVNATGIQLIISSKVQPSSQWGVAAELRKRILKSFERAHIELSVDPNTQSVYTSTSGRPYARRKK